MDLDLELVQLARYSTPDRDVWFDLSDSGDCAALAFSSVQFQFSYQRPEGDRGQGVQGDDSGQVRTSQTT